MVQLMPCCPPISLLQISLHHQTSPYFPSRTAYIFVSISIEFTTIVFLECMPHEVLYSTVPLGIQLLYLSKSQHFRYRPEIPSLSGVHRRSSLTRSCAKQHSTKMRCVLAGFLQLLFAQACGMPTGDTQESYFCMPSSKFSGARGR